MGMKGAGESIISITEIIYFPFSTIIAVQKERDRHGRPYSKNHTGRIATIKSLKDIHDEDEDNLSIKALLRAEQTAKEVRDENKISIEYLIAFIFSISTNIFDLISIRSVQNVFKLH